MTNVFTEAFPILSTRDLPRLVILSPLPGPG